MPMPDDGLTRDDHDLLNQAADLTALARHPLWPAYQALVDQTIDDIQSMLLNGLPGPPRPAAEEVATHRALRMVAKCLVTLKESPDRLRRLATDIRERMGDESPKE